ncbi:glycosyltransferase [Lignipirellula cremea]|uniref:Glycosyltransferase EpsF n=1 Tax=Lignipirellula cremea TaxID=2528010 RepID=A0A518E567_9BACT|nr:glycosyltransferase [Lignipirellula cremea]QDU99236.1 Putative glycosyltransferase EpsF [Lignipirellula cremea]
MSRQSTVTSATETRPLRTMFLITSMPIGGAETLLVNLVRRLDRTRIQPEICCLKELGPLGEELAQEMPVHHGLLGGKYDCRVLGRLTNLLRDRRIDAVVTVGAGDKMFWGRLAAWRAGCPVVLSALHSTGWPDGVGRLNRWLTPITDGFIGVASEHGRHLVENEKFPAEKVHVIPNGVDVQRFRPAPEQRARLRAELGIPADAPLVGIVAALRPEKNHLLFLRAAALLQHDLPETHFLLVGDGPEREKLTAAVAGRPIESHVHFLGSRSDVPELLAALDLFLLTSHNEANPVSILEAMATGLPVVSTRVGSVAESVEPGVTGYLAEPGHADEIAARAYTLLSDPALAAALGSAGRRKVVDRWSLERMVVGYEELIEAIYHRKQPGLRPAATTPQPSEQTTSV